MRVVAPRTGAPEIIFAEEQEEYLPVTIAVYENYLSNPALRGLLWRFTFTPEERERIAKGEDIFIMQMNFHTPMTPMAFSVGPHQDWIIKDDSGTVERDMGEGQGESTDPDGLSSP